MRDQEIAALKESLQKVNEEMDAATEEYDQWRSELCEDFSRVRLEHQFCESWHLSLFRQASSSEEEADVRRVC